MTKFITSTLANKIRTFPEKKEDIFAMLLGCCVEALSISISEQTEETTEAILSALINLLAVRNSNRSNHYGCMYRSTQCSSSVSELNSSIIRLKNLLLF